MKRILFFVLALAQVGGIFADETKDPDTLPSPYFIDGLHCTGLGDSPRVVGWFTPPEQLEVAKRVASQEDCEDILEVFGVKKFSWLTPEDLEKLSDSLRRSGYFREVEVSIKKSELKNHIHLFVSLKRRASWTHTVQEEFKYYAGKGTDSSRSTNRLRYDAQSNANEPLSSGNFGIVAEHSGAGSSLTPPSGLSAEDQTRFQNQNPYLVDLYMTPKRHVVGNSCLVGDLHFLFHNIGEPRTFYSTAYGIIDWVFPTRLSFLSGESYVTPSAFVQIGTVAPGFKFGNVYGSPQAGFLRFNYAYYHSTNGGGMLLSEYGFSGRWFFSLFGDDIFFTAKYLSRTANVAWAPLSTFPFQNQNTDTTEVGIGKRIKVLGTTADILLKTGMESIVDRKSDARLETPYTGIGINFRTEAWDVQLNAIYNFQRIY